MHSNIRSGIYFIAFILALASTSIASSAVNDNPLSEHLLNLDEVGRTLSRWEGDNGPLGSWFFSSYAMLILQNYGQDDLKPFPTTERLVPFIWRDFKSLNPRYLIELAGGTLAFSGLMKLEQEAAFQEQRSEEQYIHVIAGYAYLRMLEGTVGDSLFNAIVRSTTKSALKYDEIENSLISAISMHYDPWVGIQFRQAIRSGEWADTDIGKVRRGEDSISVEIRYNGSWSFPVEVLLVTEDGDSLYRWHSPQHQSTFTIAQTNVRSITLDPNHKLAEYYRYNNKWPFLQKGFYMQPFAVLPNWEEYSIKVTPVSWSDWDEEKRYGLRLTSGFGIDLWPVYPSDFRHRLSLEINTHTRTNEATFWGGRLGYGHPLSRKNRFFSDISFHNYNGWNGGSVGLIKYIGEQRFLIQGPRLKYQRIKLSVSANTYKNKSVWDVSERVNVLRFGYSGLSITRFGDRLLLNIQVARGTNNSENFSILKTQADLSGVFWKSIVMGVQMVGGSQSRSAPGPYQFTHDYAWQDNLAAIPNFKGQTKLTHQTNNYIGLSADGGYWFSWLQAKLFGSTMIFDQPSVPLKNSKASHAFGFGVEHKSFFTLGLYFPIWQSTPAEGEQPWAWRYQWRLVWNL